MDPQLSRSLPASRYPHVHRRPLARFPTCTESNTRQAVQHLASLFATSSVIPSKKVSHVRPLPLPAAGRLPGRPLLLPLLPVGYRNTSRTQSQSQADGCPSQQDDSLTPPRLTARAVSTTTGSVTQDQLSRADFAPFSAGPCFQTCLSVSPAGPHRPPVVREHMLHQTCFPWLQLVCVPRAQPRLETGPIGASLQLLIGATLSTHGDIPTNRNSSSPGRQRDRPQQNPWRSRIRRL